MLLRLLTPRRVGIASLALVAAACGSPSEAPGVTVTPVYSPETGRLQEILSDRDGDGRVDTYAFMDGPRLLRIEIDRDGDGEVDRWEHYGAPAVDGQPPPIERAEEADGPDRTITRRELYVDGVLDRVEEDTDLDGRVDKWEKYRRGRLAQVALDLTGVGRPTRRLVYDTDGNVDRVEVDLKGDGVFQAATEASAP